MATLLNLSGGSLVKCKFTNKRVFLDSQMGSIVRWDVSQALVENFVGILRTMIANRSLIGAIFGMEQ